MRDAGFATGSPVGKAAKYNRPDQHLVCFNYSIEIWTVRA